MYLFGCPRSGKPTTLNFVDKGPLGFPLDLYRSLVFDNFSMFQRPLRQRVGTELRVPMPSLTTTA